ncbi:hypothetical protein ymoll0001_26920 [Yersinia mollaretii ATCC 43969]|uniref:Uncharacterized protein n=1 Tax=Yersinia mollaretii (strain ATCC 43969 / DSM 18520 / CIP 103324 / CNY 7263 / WAIP 204) TaxID=349967 RepID=A0ABP2EFI1_YERMW|nr:hypothetical protein ymoll0001_26920 [Yersinia mollaretii ATCC 43969]
MFYTNALGYYGENIQRVTIFTGNCAFANNCVGIMKVSYISALLLSERVGFVTIPPYFLRVD